MSIESTKNKIAELKQEIEKYRRELHEKTRPAYAQIRSA
jgi:hypothetical protein